MTSWAVLWSRWRSYDVCPAAVRSSRCQDVPVLQEPSRRRYVLALDISRVSCQKGPICHAWAWRVGPFRQDTIDIKVVIRWLPFRRWHFQLHFLQWKIWYSIKILLKCIAKGLIDNKSSLVQVMAWCQTDDLTAPSHYLNRCWLIISEVLWHQPEDSFTGNAQAIYHWYEFKKLLI